MIKRVIILPSIIIVLSVCQLFLLLFIFISNLSNDNHVTHSLTHYISYCSVVVVVVIVN